MRSFLERMLARLFCKRCSFLITAQQLTAYFYNHFIHSSLEKKSLLRDNVDLMGSLADLYFRVGDSKNAILKFEQAQMLDPYIIKGK